MKHSLFHFKKEKEKIIKKEEVEEGLVTKGVREQVDSDFFYFFYFLFFWVKERVDSDDT